MYRKSNGNGPPNKRITNQRSFEIELSQEARDNLSYFIKQELGFYNTLVEQLAPRLRSSPNDFLSFKDKERKLWEGCAEHAVDINQMVNHPTEQWPEKLRNLASFLRDDNGQLRIVPAHRQMIQTASAAARLHPLVRRLMATEIMRYMSDQADTISAGSRTETLRQPLQMLNTHTLDTKRHLQIPASLINTSYDEEQHCSTVSVPYTKQLLQIFGYDITEIPFKMMLVRAPHPNSTSGKWRIEMRDAASYNLQATDFFERARL